MSQTRSVQLLRDNAEEIRNGYVQKQSKLCWLWRKIFSKRKQVEAIYNRIINLTPPTTDALPISNDCIPHVLQFLPIAALGNFGQINKQAKEHADLVMKAIACKFGCKDDDINLVKKYLKKLHASLQFLSKENWRYGPENQFSIRDLIERDKRGKILVKESINRLRHLSIDDLARLFAKDAPIKLLKRAILTPQISTGEVFTNKKSANKALLYAVMEKEFEVVQFLLSHGAKASLIYMDNNYSPPKDRTLLYLAIQQKTPLITELLLKNKAKITKKLLYYAARVPDNKENIKLLLEYDAKLDRLDKEIAISTAIENQDLPNVQVLVEEIIKYKKLDFEAALLHVVNYGNAEMVKLIIKIATAKVGWGSDIYLSPFFHAIANQDIDQVSAFIEGGIDLNQSDEDGRTALHQAIRCGTPEIVELLTKHGADPSLKDESDRTPLDLLLDEDVGSLFDFAFIL
ncbi:MAG: ankyrin repeat domain-containing protein [Parachlamydiaceae bacterium]